MKKPNIHRGCLIGLVAIASITQAGTETTPNAPEFKLEAAAVPPEAGEGYRLFLAKCGECHSRNRILTKKDLSPAEWTDIVFRMQDMASSHLSASQSKTILNFLIWNDRRAQKKGN